MHHTSKLHAKSTTRHDQVGKSRTSPSPRPPDSRTAPLMALHSWHQPAHPRLVLASALAAFDVLPIQPWGLSWIAKAGRRGQTGAGERPPIGGHDDNLVHDCRSVTQCSNLCSQAHWCPSPAPFSAPIHLRPAQQDTACMPTHCPALRWCCYPAQPGSAALPLPANRSQLTSAWLSQLPTTRILAAGDQIPVLRGHLQCRRWASGRPNMHRHWSI